MFPNSWKDVIKNRFAASNLIGRDIFLLNAYSGLHFTGSLSAEPSIIPSILRSLHGIVSSALPSSTGLDGDLSEFGRGRGFLFYVQLASEWESVDPDIWDLVQAHSAYYSNVPIFLEAVLAYANALTSTSQFSEEKIGSLSTALLNNLSSPSHELRLYSLRILRLLSERLGVSDSQTISIAIGIEESELTLQTERFLSMQLRKLAIGYKGMSSQKWLDQLLPNFCFGLLSKKLASLVNEACEAIKVVCELPKGQNIVSELAVHWLQKNNDLKAGSDASALDEESGEPMSYSEFQCFNVAQVEISVSRLFSSFLDPGSILLRAFKSDHAHADSIPRMARSYAIRVFNAVPFLAEKKSRYIVPHFLSWATREDDVSQFIESNANEKDPLIDSATWSQRDRKALLDVFGQFINPRVLYKAGDVHEALIELLKNGDTELQKSALRALLTWKSSSLVPYEENLFNILDDARFRDELSVFVQFDKETSTIKQEDLAELLPVLLRLLYGRIVTRSGSRTNRQTQEGRRKNILRSLSQLPGDGFQQFVEISYGTLGDIQVIVGGQKNTSILQQEYVSLRKQFGLLKMTEAMFDTLGVKMLPYAEKSMNVVLYCLIRACRILKAGEAVDQQESQTRNIRQSGIRCLDLIFSTSPNKDWSEYTPMIFKNVIDPRLDNFAIETAQGISGLLHLFYTWMSSPVSALYFVQSSHPVLLRIADSLAVESARDEVKIFVMEKIINSLLDLANGKIVGKDMEVDISPNILSRIRDDVLAPNVEGLLLRLESFLRQQSRRQMILPSIETISKLAPFVKSTGETTNLIRTATHLLQQPVDRVPPKARSGLLRILHHFLSLYDPSGNRELNDEIFGVLSSLFDYFKDDPNRKLLAEVFSSFAKSDMELKEVAPLCEDLNALSETKLDEVDFDRRLRAFRIITEEKYSKFTPRQWRPLLFNFLYHVKDEEELAIRSSSSYGLKRFVEGAVPSDCGNDKGFASLLENILLPALKNGVKQQAEIVRVEFVTTMGHVVSLHPEFDAVNDMRVLLAGGDEEASFFNNILHIQQHRRVRALRRLATETDKGKIKSSNIGTFLMPLIEHYIFDQDSDENAHNLTAEAVSTIGTISSGLEWNQFRAVFRRYKGYITSRPGMEKKVIRLLGKLTDTLSEAINVEDTQMTDVSHDQECEMPEPTALRRSLPASSKIAWELKTNFIVFLSEFIHHKDETEMSLRLPAAVTTVKLIKLVPQEEHAILLPPVLLDVSQVLKSKAQDSRDIARKTLSDIVLILGPFYLGYILRELRGTLQRGYQLHVLSYTVHTILVSTTDHFQTGDLDDNLEALVAIIIDDTFGTVGQEKEAEEYVSKMKEVKSSKSYDSMELLAKNSSVRRLGTLIRPIQMLLKEKLTTSLVQKIDELLRRVSAGLIRNPGAESIDTLVFSYEVIKESYARDDMPDMSAIPDREAQRRARFLVNLKGHRHAPNRGSTSSYMYKLARFGLDVIRSVLNKFNSLNISQNVSGFLPMIGDALLQGYEEVKISAVKLLSTIIKLPLDDLDNNCMVYVVEAISMVREAPSTNTEAAQAALKFLASIIRERKKSKIKDSQLAYLLKRITNDIEEPDRQGIAFNFIRAVMSRKFVVPEMYEFMDSVASMMVTNHSRSARDLARGVFVHFIIEYPQAKSRWTKQLGFLAKNLEYVHAEGRQSVMETIHMLLSKIGGSPAQDLVTTLFLPVVLVLANDDSVECREMAGVLLGNILEQADSEKIKSMLSPLHTWLEQTENLPLTCTGLQAMRIFFDTQRPNKDKELPFVTESLLDIIKVSEDRDEGSWEVLYYSFQLFFKLCQLFPKMTIIPDCSPIWTEICENLFYPHSWIRLCSTNLVGLLLADEAKHNASSGYGKVPLVGSSGLQLDSDTMRVITRAGLTCLKSPILSEELATQTVRNLVFLGRCFAQNNLNIVSKLRTEDLSDDSEEESDGAMSTDRPKPAIQYIFERTAAILRREPLNTRAESLVGKTASMKLLGALCAHLDVSYINPSLQTILLPLLHLTDSSISAPRSLDETFQTNYKALCSSSQEILDLLQKKLGTTEFVSQMATAQEQVKARRGERKVKRRIEAVADPEKFNQEKKRKHERKRERRKESGHNYQKKRRGM